MIEYTHDECGEKAEMYEHSQRSSYYICKGCMEIVTDGEVTKVEKDD